MGSQALDCSQQSSIPSDLRANTPDRMDVEARVGTNAAVSGMPPADVPAHLQRTSSAPVCTTRRPADVQQLPEPAAKGLCLSNALYTIAGASTTPSRSGEVEGTSNAEAPAQEPATDKVSVDEHTTPYDWVFNRLLLRAVKAM